MLSPTLRQFMIAISTQLAAFSIGGAVTYPTLLLEQFQSNETTVDLDVESKSWIGSIYGPAGMPAILMPMLIQKIGRKLGFIFNCTILIIGWILTYVVSNGTGMLIGESFLGLGINSLMSVSLSGLAEMLAPKYRFIAMETYGIMQIIGMASCGIMGRFLHFKTVSIVMLIPITIAMMIALTWPESPSWLAYKGKFQKCEETFIKLRGSDVLSKKELEELISAQEVKPRHSAENGTSFKTIWTQITSRDFYMPTLHTFVLLNMMYWSGFNAIYIYFIELVSKSTNDVNATFYAAILMYVIIFVGASIANILVMRFRLKSILLSSVSSSITSLFCALVITGLQSVGMLAKDTRLLMYSLLAFMACTSLGLNTMVFGMSVELMPVKHKSLGGAMLIIFNCVLYATSLQLSPYLFLYLGLFGTFFIYIVNTIACALYVWKYVPETKGRNLQQIEEFYIHGHFLPKS